MTATSLDASEILAIPKDRPEKLFPYSEDLAVATKRILASKWQPRLANDDPAVMAHINFLWDARELKIKAGTWEAAGVLELVGPKGMSRFKYKRYAPFELGGAYYASSLVGYYLLPDYSDLANNASSIIASFNFKDSKLRAEAKRYLPEVFSDFSANGGRLITVRKGDNLICLRHVLEHLGGEMDPKHVAWVLSCMYSLACYLKISRIAHNAFSLDNYFVDPSDHSGALLGGWWYAKRFGDKLTFVPSQSHDFMPTQVRLSKLADPLLDLELIKACGRELLGDRHGSRLLLKKDLPNELVQWLRQPAGPDAIIEYKTWYERVLPASFGRRRFVKLEIKPSDIY